MPGKYQPLADWLAAQPGPRVALTFAQIEQLLGAPLPPTARAGTGWWWATEPRRSHVQGWRGVG